VLRAGDLPDGQAYQFDLPDIATLDPPKMCKISLRLKTNFLSEFKLIWLSRPDGKGFSSWRPKFSFRKSEIVVAFAIPPSPRGALAIVTNVGAGCGGRFGDARRATPKADG
jgi:hypothetical protein